jgi:choline transport protein
MWSVAPNAIIGLLVIVTLAFTSGDVQQLMATPTGEPFIQIFYDVTQSKAAATVMASIVVILLCSCCFSEVATSSRQLWSFARDRGFPASSWLSHVCNHHDLRCTEPETLTIDQVQPGWNIPVRAVMVSFVVVSALACINLGSTTALRSISSLGAVAILSSYLVVIGCLIWRRLYGAPLPPRRWSLGKAGLAINIVAVCFILPLWFFAFWPTATPVTAETMNWASVIFMGVLSIAVVYYLAKGRREYDGPVALIKRDE